MCLASILPKKKKQCYGGPSRRVSRFGGGCPRDPPGERPLRGERPLGERGVPVEATMGTLLVGVPHTPHTPHTPHHTTNWPIGLAKLDRVGHAIRLATDLDPWATVLSIDVLRSGMLGKIFQVESLRGLLPFVPATYAQPSCYHCQDEHCRVRQIRQRRGGDPLMPLLVLSSSAQ